jgi:PAS domain S-box-containing protein
MKPEFHLTQHKLTEEMLRDEEKNYKLLAEHSADVIYKIHLETEQFSYISPSVKRLLGYTVEEALSLKVRDIMTAESFVKQQDRFLKAIAGERKAPEIMEIEAVHKDGHIVPVEIHADFILNEQGIPVEILGVVRDITRRRQVEDRAEKMNLLNQNLLLSDDLKDKLKRITDGVVEIFNADIAMVWVLKPGDLCNSDCIHTQVEDDSHGCKKRDMCLHLLSSSGRDTHIIREHRRIPFDSHKIGQIAAGTDTQVVVNDVAHDPGFQDKEWIRKLGLISFAGYRLLSEFEKPVGVLALFSKQTISSETGALLEGLANTTSHVIQASLKGEALLQERDKLQDAIAQISDTNRDLRDSENRYRGLSDAAFEGIVISEKGTFIEVNSALAKMFDYLPTELVGVKATDIVAPDLREKVLNKILSGDEKPYESIGIKKAGIRFPIEVQAKMFSYKGRRVRVTAVRDLTEKKHAEKALQDSERKYQDLYDNAPDMFVSVDAKTATVLQCNQTTAEALGYTEAEIIGHPIFDLYTTDSAVRAKTEVFPTFLNTGSIKGEELQLRRKDGSILDVSLNVSAVRDEEGNILLSRSVWRDISRRKEVEADREELINNLQEALKEIKTLKGILPICSFCKMVRDDKGCWEQLDVYIQKYSDANISHGICPDCVKEHYPELDL